MLHISFSFHFVTVKLIDYALKDTQIASYIVPFVQVFVGENKTLANLSIIKTHLCKVCYQNMSPN